MTQQEKSVSLGRNIDEWADAIINALKQRFDHFENRSGETWFAYSSGAFHLVAFVEPLYGFVMEFAKGTTKKDMDMAIDIGQWSLLDYESSDDLLQAMLKLFKK